MLAMLFIEIDYTPPKFRILNKFAYLFGGLKFKPQTSR